MVSRAYASFAILVPLLRWLLVIKLLMWFLNLLIFKVALRVDSVKVAKILMRIWEAAVWCWCDEILKIVVSSYINWLFHLILSIALLFELLMYWWRNRWVALYWYNIFFCGNEIFEFLKNCFSLKLLFNVLIFFMLAPSRKFLNLLMFSDVRCFCDLLNFESWFLMYLHIING